MALVAVAVFSNGAHAADSIGWRLPAVGGALTGGFDVVYAERSGAGMADIYAGLSVLSQDDALTAALGVQRIGYRVGAVFPILDMFEAGVDIGGSSVSARGGSAVVGSDDELSSFGDIKLRGKYYRRHGALGFAGIVGYDLYQGVQDRSTVADVASPLAGLGLSYFGRDCKAPNASRIHLNAIYVYDRTINFLDGTRTPSRFERFAWQMRDYTYMDIKAGVEYELAALLPIVEYALEVPVNDVPGGRSLIHTISPGLKFNPIDALAVALSVDFGIGGDKAVAPVVPLYDISLGLIYRFKGGIVKPGSVPNDDTQAPQTIDDILPAAPPETMTPPVDIPVLPPPEQATTPTEPELPVAAPENAVPADIAPQETAPATPPPVTPPDPKKKPGAPVDLEQFAE